MQRLKTIGADAPPVREMTGMAGAKLFHAAVNQAKKTNKYGAQVSLKTQDEYANMRLFMTPDGKAGFALNGDDIVSVFNHGMSPHSGVSTELVMLAVEQGGRKLDNYDTFLSHIYKRLGFEETQRYPWDEAQRAADWDKEVFKKFNKGEPDYLYMQYRPTGSLVDRLVEGGKLGAPEEVIQRLPEDMLEGVDLKRFDERLRATVTKPTGQVEFLPSADEDSIINTMFSATNDPNRLEKGKSALEDLIVRSEGFSSADEYNAFHRAQAKTYDQLIADPERMKAALDGDASVIAGTGIPDANLQQRPYLTNAEIDNLTKGMSGREKVMAKRKYIQQNRARIENTVILGILNADPKYNKMLSNQTARKARELELQQMTRAELKKEIDRVFDPRRGLKSVK